MKVVSILQAQALQILRPFGTFGYLPDAVKMAVERYQFVDYPKETQQLLPPDPSQPIVFRHGKLDLDKYDHAIVIDVLQIYAAGITVVTRTDTTDAMIALEHLLGWATEQFNIAFERVRNPGFWSQLNVHFVKPLPELFPALKPVADMITAKHGEWLPFRPQLELTTLHFNYEPRAGISSVPFRIERAANIAFDEELYSSDAPLQTAEHIEVLEQFEELCLHSGSRH